MSTSSAPVHGRAYRAIGHRGGVCTPDGGVPVQGQSHDMLHRLRGVGLSLSALHDSGAFALSGASLLPTWSFGRCTMPTFDGRTAVLAHDPWHEQLGPPVDAPVGVHVGGPCNARGSHSSRREPVPLYAPDWLGIGLSYKHTVGLFQGQHACGTSYVPPVYMRIV